MNPVHVLVRILVWAGRIGAVVAVLYGTWVFMVEALSGTRFHIATVWGVWAIVGALAVIHLALWLIERTMDWTAEAAEGRRVAKLLADSYAAGHKWVTVSDLSTYWLEPLPENPTIRNSQWNSRLRTLKDAIEQGLLRADLQGDSFPSMKSSVEISSAISFFRKRRWHQVKPRQGGEVYSDERTKP